MTFIDFGYGWFLCLTFFFIASLYNNVCTIIKDKNIQLKKTDKTFWDIIHYENKTLAYIPSIGILGKLETMAQHAEGLQFKAHWQCSTWIYGNHMSYFSFSFKVRSEWGCLWDWRD